jgi:signal transduction histidine kinase
MDAMADARSLRLPAKSPSVAPPPAFVERRETFRRAADREAHEERALLARTLDVLAAGSDAESRLGGLLDVLARTVGASRSAVVADGHDRRVAVSVCAGENPEAAEALAAWLDAAARRSRADRAASAPAPVSLVLQPGVEAPERSPDEQHFACLELPNAGSVTLGFDFPDAESAAALRERLPPGLARHAAAALSLVTEQLAIEGDLATFRARDEERTRYVSTVAHELRTPLTGLSGYLDLVLAGKVEDPAVQREFLERGQDIVATMSALVSDLLELSRLESGTLALEVGAFSVAEAGARVVSGLAPIAIDRGIELSSDLPPRLRAATGDRRRVEQILTNLVGNALKFATPGGLVELAARFDGSVAIFVVRDDGAGIGSEDRPRVFERFYRMTGHERVTGTGLGLPIARDLARAMGGDLDVASVAGTGTSFVLVLEGPAPVDSDVVAAALGRALAEEEITLEELAVLRALGPTAVRGGHLVLTRGGRPRSIASAGGGAPVRLRSIDGSLARGKTPA